MAIKVYDPASVVVLFNGIPLSGYADGTFISASQNTPAFTLFVGTSGEAARALTNNQSGTIQVTLQQTSTSNDVLSAFHAADLVAPAGVSIAAVLVKDLNGSTLMLATTSWITKFPDVSFSRGVGNWTWTIETDRMIFGVGGANSHESAPAQ